LSEIEDIVFGEFLSIIKADSLSVRRVLSA